MVNEKRATARIATSLVRITGEAFKSLESPGIGQNDTWLTNLQVQFLLEWVFRDNKHPLMNRYFVVPTAVTLAVKEVFYCSCVAGTVLKILHKFCKENWRKLECFMLLFPRQHNRNHWNVEVAVNPFQMLHHVVGSDMNMGTNDCGKGSKHLYGFFYIDPFEGMRVAMAPFLQTRSKS